MTEATALENQELGGRYVIERELGRGGTSTVYLAHDRVYDRRVAVKVLRRELALSVGPDRFLREIRVTARLNHPHIAPVIDSGVGDGWCFFVSTYFDGGTLRQRLERERQLPVDDAINIARAIAGALDYAHARKILHCDVKPENILFSNGEAFLTDFGIARLFEAGLETTSTGIVRGTPAYMSPEQAGGEKGYDGRTDIYSLGCVLYEALAGVPAFVGATPQAVLAQRFLHAPRDLRVYRPTVPAHVEATIARATALSPDDRFATAGEFAAALKTRGDVAIGTAEIRKAHAPVSGGGAELDGAAANRWSWLTRRRVALGALVVAVPAAATIWAARPDGGLFSRDENARLANLESSPTVVFPFVRDSLRDAFSGEDLYLHDALVRWRGLRVIDVPRARALYAQRDSTRFSMANARKLALDLGARRFIWGRFVDRGGTPTIVANIYDARGDDEPLRTSSVPIPAAGVRDSVFDYLASALAFGPARAMGSTGLAGTRSEVAKAAYSRGIAAVKEWDLTRADSAFTDALDADPDYSQALLWRAQVAGWRSDTSSAWRELASNAMQREAYLGARDRALARAMYFHASGQFPKACPIYQQLAATDAQDFTAWYGLGECLSHDTRVVPDSSSPSGWRFRASYAAALAAYQRAFALLPAVSRGFRSHAFAPLQELLFTRTNQLRSGQTENGEQFFSYPSWESDSLAFVPFPLARATGANPLPNPASTNQAIEQNRRLFHRIAETWSRALPKDASVLEALGIALDLRGNSSGVDSVSRALQLAATPERLGLAGVLVWLQVKRACGASESGKVDTAMLSTASSLADSVLRNVPLSLSPNDVPLVLGLSALTGQPSIGAEIARRYATPVAWRLAGRPVTVSSRIIGNANAFLLYAAVGAPSDSIIELARRADASIRSDLSEDTHADARDMFLTRPTSLAFPVVGRPLTLGPSATSDYLLAAQEAFINHSVRGVKERLAEIRLSRRHLRPADLTFDALYPEAWLLAKTGDRRGALARIVPSLDALIDLPPQMIEDAGAVGPLGRAMALRANLELELSGPQSAKPWRECVAGLWARSEPSVLASIGRVNDSVR